MKSKMTIKHLLIPASAAALLVACGEAPKKPEAPIDQVEEQAPEPESTSARPAHWGYGGDLGPSTWATLDAAYAKCGSGHSQSPIDIESSDVRGTNQWKLDYGNTALKVAHNEHMDEIIDNGHTIQVSVDEGSTFTFGDNTYELKQFHFHTPSEHQVDGKNLPMEMHMVHQSDDGALAVVSVLFQEGETPNENIAKLIEHMPTKAGDSKHLPDVVLELDGHMPGDHFGYAYSGSLTTPPCSEDVQWLVLGDMLTVTADQIEAFSSVIGPNNRPVQDLNGRVVEASDLVENVSE